MCVYGVVYALEIHLPPKYNYTFSSLQFSCSVMSDSATPWTAARQASLSSPPPTVYSNFCPLSQ